MSLSAEKLDTTFVLDMVVDTTPCYYTEYNSKGQITRYGKYSNSPYYFSHVNVGYVTDMTGKKVETIYYVRDRVTKQWSVKKNLLGDIGTPSFYSDGMLKSIDESYTKGTTEYSSITIFSTNGALGSSTTEDIEHGTEYSYSNQEEQYDSYGNITLSKYSSGSGHKGGDAWSYGDNTTTKNYKNEYDNRGNLIASTLNSVHTYTEGDEDSYVEDESGKHYVEPEKRTNKSTSKEEHQYDAQNRRIKTIRYNFNDGRFVLKDSTIYSYGHALHEGEACLLSLIINDNPVDSFSPNKLHYDLPDVMYNDLKFITPSGSITEKTYDARTNTLTLVVKGAEAEQVKTYTFALKKGESFITTLRPDSNILSIGFSPEKYQYDELENFYVQSFDFSIWSDNNYIKLWSNDTLQNGIQYTYVYFDVSEDADATYTYDSRKGIFTITVKGSDFMVNPDNVHTYTFKTKKIENAYISSLQFNGKDFEGFSPDIYDYEMPADATLNEISDWHFKEKTYPECLYTTTEYSHSTHTMTISLYSMYTYTFMSTRGVDTLATYRFHYKPDIRSVEDNSKTYGKTKLLDGFSENVYEYELGKKYYPGRLKYFFWYSQDSIIINESFDGKTNILTVSASFKNDSIRVTNYYFHFPEGYEGLLPPSLHLTIGDRDGIVIDSTEFEAFGFYDSVSCQYNVTNGKIVSEHFDDSANVLTIVVLDEFSVNETEYHIHFNPLPSISSLLVDGEPVDSFSSNIHDYWIDREYTPNLVSYNLPKGVVATESFDDSTNILTISVRFATENTTQPAPATSQNMALPVRHAPNNASVTVEYRIHFRPTDGVDDFLGERVNLYVMDKTICVDGAEEPLFVYDLLGALVGTGRGEEVRIPIPQTGVYIVRAGRKAAKVVVR